MSVDGNFPVKDRLSSLYSSDKVIAFEKKDVYLIITIEPESEGGVGGIFIDDQQYIEFISDKDKVVIGGSVYYLSRSHHDISGLLDSHAGPGGWSMLAEYVPNVITQSGTFRGYENMIKKNGFVYNFFIASKQGGKTDPQLQQEIIGILESIDW